MKILSYRECFLQAVYKYVSQFVWVKHFFLSQIASIVFFVEWMWRQPYRVVRHTLAGEVTDTPDVLCILVPRASKHATSVLFTAVHARAWPSWSTVCIINTPQIHNIINKTNKHTREMAVYQCVRWKQCFNLLYIDIYTSTPQSWVHLHFPRRVGGERESKALLVVQDNDQL